MGIIINNENNEIKIKFNDYSKKTNEFDYNNIEKEELKSKLISDVKDAFYNLESYGGKITYKDFNF